MMTIAVLREINEKFPHHEVRPTAAVIRAWHARRPPYLGPPLPE